MRRLVRACGDGGIVRDVCLGQLLSCLITMTAVCSELLVRRGFEAPSAQVRVPVRYKEAKKKRKNSVDVIYPFGIIGDVSVKLLKSVSNFLFSGVRIVGRHLYRRVSSVPAMHIGSSVIV
jgi:hypothetical protein